MSGEVIMMSINEGFFFWRAFKISENCTIKYEQLYSIFAKELEQWAKKNNKISFLNFTHIYQRNASLYIYSDTDVNQKKAVTNIAEEVTLNSEILVRFNTACFNNYKPNFSFLQTKKRMFPTLSKSEANEAIIKGDRVANTSAKTALKFYKCALKYSVFKYAKALYKQKKWRQFSPLIDLLKEENPQNAEVSLMIAKFYEFYDDNVRSIQAYKEALIFSDSPSLLIECSKLFDTFIDCTKNVFLFNCELARVQPILVEYKNLLRNEYLLKELGNKDEEKIDSLKQYLEALKPIKKYDYDQIDYSMLSFNILNDVNILGAKQIARFDGVILFSALFVEISYKNLHK